MERLRQSRKQGPETGLKSKNSLFPSAFSPFTNARFWSQQAVSRQDAGEQGVPSSCHAVGDNVWALSSLSHQRGPRARVPFTRPVFTGHSFSGSVSGYKTQPQAINQCISYVFDSLFVSEKHPLPDPRNRRGTLRKETRTLQMASHAQKPMLLPLQPAFEISAWLCSSEPQTCALVSWRPCRAVTHGTALLQPPRGLARWLPGGCRHARRGGVGRCVCVCSCYWGESVHPKAGWHRGRDSYHCTEALLREARRGAGERPCPGEGRPSTCLLRPAEERALICPGWQCAKLSLVQTHLPDTRDTFLKGSPAKGCKPGWLRPALLYNLSLEPHLSAEQACCDFPPHPGSICMQILPHLFLLPSERTNLV